MDFTNYPTNISVFRKLEGNVRERSVAEFSEGLALCGDIFPSDAAVGFMTAGGYRAYASLIGLCFSGRGV